MKRIQLLAVLLCPAALMFPPGLRAANLVWTNTAGGNWSVANNWLPHQVPGAADTAEITADGTYTVTLDAAATIASLTLGGGSGTQTFVLPSTRTLTLNGTGTVNKNGVFALSGGVLTGAGNLTVDGPFQWSGGALSGSGATFANGGLTLTGFGGKTLAGRTLVNTGAANWSAGQINLNSGGVLSNAPSGTFDCTFAGGSMSVPNGVAGPAVANAGRFRKTAAAAGAITISSPIAFHNTGTVEVQSGTLSFGGTCIQTAGLTLLDGGDLTVAQPFQLLGGTLAGTNIVFGSVTNSGAVSPGASPGRLTITGTYIQTAEGALNLELAGTSPGVTFDQLIVSNAVTLAGTLNVTLADGFLPPPNFTFAHVARAVSRSGTFARFNYPSNNVGLRITYGTTNVDLEVGNTPPTVPAIADQTVDELTLLSFNVHATDADLPAQTPSYALINSPTNANIAASGLFTWTPTEEQGPMTTRVTVLVTDNGVPNLTVTNTFLVVVNEVTVPTGTAGNLDLAFDPDVASAAGGYVNGVAVQPDRKIVIGGQFTGVHGQPFGNIARLLANGSIDAAAAIQLGTGTDSGGPVSCVAVQTDGKILLGGQFTEFNGNPHNYLVRLHRDGTVENAPDFAPQIAAPGRVNCLAVQADGMILIGGTFTMVQGQSRNGIARLRTNGALDPSFDPGTGAEGPVGGRVHSVAVQADGMILIGGEFTTFGGVARNGIARLDSLGVLDAGFNPVPGLGGPSGGWVNCLAVQADGRILIGGQFDHVNGQPCGNLARLTAGGAVEPPVDFNPGLGADGFVSSLVVQADGKIVVGGAFNSVNNLPRGGIARLLANGTVETTATFDPGAGANGFSVNGVTLQADGKILLGGPFNRIASETRHGIARLHNDPISQSLATSGGVRVSWARGGAGPEVGQVSFELTADGVNWVSLGAGSRIVGGWERTGLTLPSGGLIRARGRTTGGEGNGSSGLVEFIAEFSGDNFTETPTLAQPAPDTLTRSPVVVSFILPEAALAGSVTLSFGVHTLVLAASQEGAGVHSFSFDPANPTASPAIASGAPIADGTYTITLAYQDGAGNPAASATSANVTLDTTPPETAIDSGPSGTVPGTGATFTFSANDPNASFRASLDGAPFTLATSPASYADLSVGPHSFSVVATDLAGNADPTPATRSWTVELPPAAGFALAPVAPVSGTEHLPVAPLRVTTVEPLPAGRVLDFAFVGENFGATLAAATGDFAWVPGELDGGQARPFTVRATSNETPPVSHEVSFSVQVTEANVPPEFTNLRDLTVAQGTPISLQLDATDADLPAQPLSFSLLSGPDGLAVSSAGLLSWAPTPQQVGNVFPVTVRVTDSLGGLAERGFTATATARVHSFVAHWIGAADGVWSNPANWDIGRAPINSNTDTYDVIWDGPPVTVSLDRPIAIRNFTFASGGVLTGPQFKLTVVGAFQWSQGTLKMNDGGMTVQGAATLEGTNAVSLKLDGGTLFLKGHTDLRSTLNFFNGARLVNEAGAVFEAHGSAGLKRDNTLPAVNNSGIFRVLTGAQPFPCIWFINSGVVEVAARAVEFDSGRLVDFEQPDGTLQLAGATLNGKVQIDNGTLRGNGQVRSATVLGRISGRLSFDALALGVNATSVFNLGGTARESFDHFSVAGPLVLAGKVEVRLTDGFQPLLADDLEIVTATAGVSGQFSNVNLGQRVPVTDGAGSFVLAPSTDSKSIVLRDFVVVPFTLGPDALAYWLPETAMDPGGCFVAPNASINLPEGNWAGGSLRVQIGLDRVSFKDHFEFLPGGGLVVTEQLPNGSKTLSFLGEPVFENVRIQDYYVTCDFNSNVRNEAIVALLGRLLFRNDAVTAFSLSEVTERFPRRTCNVTLKDGAGEQNVVTQEIAFPYLTGIGLPDDGDGFQDGRLAVPANRDVDPLFPQVNLILRLEGIFSNSQRLFVPNLNSVWNADCDAVNLKLVVDYLPLAGAREVEPSYEEEYSCLVTARAGQLEACVVVERVVCPIQYVGRRRATCAEVARHDGGNAQSGVSLANFYALQSLMKETAAGRRLVDLYWQHAAEVVQIVVANPGLRDQMIDILTTFQPGVSALLAGKGQQEAITPAMIDQLNVLWNGIAAKANPALKSALQQEQARFNGFQQFAAKGFSQWAELLQVPVPTQPRVYLSGISRENGRFSVEVNEIPGMTLSLWRSPDLKDWAPVPNVEILKDGFTIRFTDPAPPVAEAFYEVRP